MTQFRKIRIKKHVSHHQASKASIITKKFKQTTLNGVISINCDQCIGLILTTKIWLPIIINLIVNIYHSFVLDHKQMDPQIVNGTMLTCSSLHQKRMVFLTVKYHKTILKHFLSYTLFFYHF